MVVITRIIVLLLALNYCCGEKEMILPRVKITSMHVESKVIARLARVLVTTQVKNYENQSHETQFTFQLPDTAFISNFTMTRGSEVIQGIVKEKAAAAKIYKDAKKQGVSAAIIDRTTQDPNREMKIFTVSVNTAGQSKAVFSLEYHELLERKLGEYKQRISFQPKQIVTDLVFKAKIYEQQGINEFRYVLPESNVTESSSADSAVMTASDNSRELYFKPSIKYQASHDPHYGISGEIVLYYDVDHGETGSIILQENDYFVHYVAPSGFPILNKNIIFIIDISGSMSGLKIEQARNAMLSILGQLHTGDYFNILLFDNTLEEWFSEPLPASHSNVHKAKTFVRDKLYARGGTGIHRALLKGVDLLDITKSLGGTRGNIIVFLTDGRPTTGVTNTKQIRQDVTAKNKHRFSIYSLGFGFDVDMRFLKALSWENGGFARRIYAEGDASKQLEKFYNELHDPTLVDVNVVYQTNDVELASLTKTSFPVYFKGAELLIAGKLNKPGSLEWTAVVNGKGAVDNLNTKIGPTLLNVRENGGTSVMEKMWAYMKINDLLKAIEITDEIETKNMLKNQTLYLSLKYNFVTPLTSMVVSESLSSSTENQDEIMSKESHVMRKSKSSYGKRGQMHGFVPKSPAIYPKRNNDIHVKSRSGLIQETKSMQGSNSGDIIHIELMVSLLCFIVTMFA